MSDKKHTTNYGYSTFGYNHIAYMFGQETLASPCYDQDKAIDLRKESICTTSILGVLDELYSESKKVKKEKSIKIDFDYNEDFMLEASSESLSDIWNHENNDHWDDFLRNI